MVHYLGRLMIVPEDGANKYNVFLSLLVMLICGQRPKFVSG